MGNSETKLKKFNKYVIQGNEAKLIKIIDKFDDITERIFDDNTKSLLEYVIEYAKNTYNKSISQENYFKILDLVLENGKINKKDKNIFVKIINVMIKLVKDVNFYVWLKVTENYWIIIMKISCVLLLDMKLMI